MIAERAMRAKLLAPSIIWQSRLWRAGKLMTISSHMINTIINGTASKHPPLLIAHGLFGSAKNWGAIAKRLATDRQVITPDMRNHGHSGWFDSHNYHDMAADLAGLIKDHGGRADVIGHSMGGKAAMVLACAHPDLVNRLIIADIAPVSYDRTHQGFISAMRGLDLSQIVSRSDADALLKGEIPDDQTRAFLLQSLDIKEKRWRLNLDVLEAEMPKIMGFPEVKTLFGGPTLFLSGGASDFVLPQHRSQIKALFPKARFACIPKVGHWLHAENPRAFVQTAQVFLNA